MKKPMFAIAIIILLSVPFLGMPQITGSAKPTCSASEAISSELSWTESGQFPIVKGKIMYPTLPPSDSPPNFLTHWYAGAAFPTSEGTQNASSICASIDVPNSLPLLDEFYYVLLSAWDSNGSYDQIGLCDAFGIWGLAYSWTTGPPDNLTYNYNPDAVELAYGVTYTFNISFQLPNIALFAAYQGSTLYWSQGVPTGGNYLNLTNEYAGYPNAGYTDYEECWYTDTNGSAPGFNFYFHGQSWVATNGSSYAATWTNFTYAGIGYTVSPFVSVVINGDSVLVMNLGTDVTVSSVDPLPPHYSVFQVYHHGMRYDGQNISITYAVTVMRSDNDTNYALDCVEVGLNRTNVNNSSDCRNIGTTEVSLAVGGNTTRNFVWNETNTMNSGNYSITGYAHSVDNDTWEMNSADNQLTNDTVQAEELIGDINGDGIVDIYDALNLAGAFGSTPASPNWNPDADLNYDGTVDIYDSVILDGHFGQYICNGTEGLELGGMSNGTVQPATGGTPSVVVDPAQQTMFKGEVFAVNVEVTGVTGMQGWEFQLYWNSTVLNCTNVAVQTPSVWQNHTQNFGAGLEPNYNATCARYWQAQAGTYPASSFNGSMTIVTLTFKALQPGSTSLTLADVKLGNSTAQPIACTVSSGSVTVYFGRYMRSDTQTINGLGAYVLNIPESGSYNSVTQSGSGQGASWGIRAFVRHSNGSEQEISLDGQTGTPTALVYGSGGSGLQSATVAVAQTGLQSTDSLVIRVYVSIGDGSWTQETTFTTERLNATTLKAATWTVYYYTQYSYLRQYNLTTSKFYWGTTTYESRIQNLQYT